VGIKNVTINGTANFQLNNITNYVVLYKNNASAVPQAGHRFSLLIHLSQSAAEAGAIRQGGEVGGYMSEVANEEDKGAAPTKLEAAPAPPPPPKKSPMGGALKGAGTGAAIGSVVPGIGTVIGAGLGAVMGGLSEMHAGGVAGRHGYATDGSVTGMQTYDAPDDIAGSGQEARTGFMGWLRGLQPGTIGKGAEEARQR
jgi:hypothetical protein